jgi:hypothetical protein
MTLPSTECDDYSIGFIGTLLFELVALRAVRAVLGAAARRHHPLVPILRRQRRAVTLTAARGDQSSLLAQPAARRRTQVMTCRATERARPTRALPARAVLGGAHIVQLRQAPHCLDRDRQGARGLDHRQRRH